MGPTLTIVAASFCGLPDPGGTRRAAELAPGFHYLVQPSARNAARGTALVRMRAKDWQAWAMPKGEAAAGARMAAAFEGKKAALHRLAATEEKLPRPVAGEGVGAVCGPLGTPGFA